MEKEIGRIQKSEYQGTTTEIIVGIKEFNGKAGLDIREFVKSESYTGPTKKGLRIPEHKFEEFKSIINSINPTDLKSDEPTTSQQAEPKEADTEDAGISENGLM